MSHSPQPAVASVSSDPRLSPASPLPAGLELVLLSATVLFLELALIRWGAGQVRVIAYFPNLLLIGSFLGLGLGCLRVGRASLAVAWMPALLVLTVCYAALGRIAFTQGSPQEHLWLLYYDLPPNAPVVRNVWAPVVACFALAVLAFIPPGQMVADRLRAFQQAGRGLKGYGWDLGGSVIGTSVFAVVAFLRLVPLHWFGIAVLVSAVFFLRSKRALLVHLACGACLLVVLHRSERAQLYSPYYALSVVENGEQIQILANGSLHQMPINVDPLGPARGTAPGYHLPFTRHGHKPRRALVLGAGSGNDVATLLMQGAEQIDAVEIDPAIIEIGRRLHPNRPYDSPRVRIINTDARAFLNDTDEHYDTIVFGTLDSMTRLSALSNVRLDNFVYTVDCFKAARQRLTGDGALILYFMSAHEGLTLRLAGLLTEAFGETPVIHRGAHNLFNVILMAGPAFTAAPAETRQLPLNLTIDFVRQLGLPDDDWPFLYLDARSISGFYWIIMAWIGGIALAGVALASPQLRQGLFGFKGADAPMFFFGLAFLLLETRAVTAMNLVWGGTWLTSAVVFGAILLTVLGGTLLFSRLPFSLSASMAGLVLSLLVLYFTPAQWLLTMNVPSRLALSLLVVGAPVFFASTGFARIYDSRADVGLAFGWNLLGAVAGGLLEFSSMVIGLRALLLIALVAYLAAYLVERRRSALANG